MLIRLSMGAPFENKPRQIFFANNPIVTVGNGSYIGGATLDSHRSSGHVLIGNYTSIAYNIDFVIGRDHEMNGLSTYPIDQLDMGGDDEKLGKKYFNDYKEIKYGSNKDLLVVGHDVWIGRDCMIMGGITIGNGAVIGAGTVVAKDIPPYCIAVGNPVRIIKKRFSDDMIDKLEKIKWWYWPKEKLMSIVKKVSSLEDVDEFINEYYHDEPIVVDQDILALKEENNTVVYWKLPNDNEVALHVIENYISNFNKGNKIVLLIEMDKETQRLIPLVKKMIEQSGELCPQICVYVLQQDVSYLKGLFSQVDYVVLNKDYNSVIYSDYALDYHTHILYSYDENVFKRIKKETHNVDNISQNKRILFLGNSLTLHGQTSYWWGTWGMAASEKNKDYVHVFRELLNKKGISSSIEAFNYYLWEVQANDRAETFSLLTQYMGKHPDLVVLQLGENIQDIGTLYNDFKELILYIRNQLDDVEIVLIGNFWASDEIESIKEDIAAETGVRYVSVKDLWNDEKYMCGIGTKVYSDNGEWHIVEHGGVARHPGDIGHRELAVRLLKAVGL